MFELSPTAEGAWTETVLFTYDVFDGQGAKPNPFLDSGGNLFGTTVNGGHFNVGTVYELSPVSGGGWSFRYLFLGGLFHGSEPLAPVLEDSSGNIFGTTFRGGPNDGGVIFELSTAGGVWTYSTLHVFGYANDGQPIPKGSAPLQLIGDGNGGFYGVTMEGGTVNSNCTVGCGVVFHLTQTSNGGWTETVLHKFSGGYDGAAPREILKDASGNIYGTTGAYGNAACDCGTVFEIVNPAGVAK